MKLNAQEKRELAEWFDSTETVGNSKLEDLYRLVESIGTNQLRNDPIELLINALNQTIDGLELSNRLTEGYMENHVEAKVIEGITRLRDEIADLR